MKNLILLLVLICSSAFAVQVPVPEFAKYINDLTGTLTR
ncbi:TPA: TPM domain-containing protein, partial [Escherichia coli]